jgi:hypothetical protein
VVPGLPRWKFGSGRRLTLRGVSLGSAEKSAAASNSASASGWNSNLILHIFAGVLKKHLALKCQLLEQNAVLATVGFLQRPTVYECIRHQLGPSSQRGGLPTTPSLHLGAKGPLQQFLLRADACFYVTDQTSSWQDPTFLPGHCPGKDLTGKWEPLRNAGRPTGIFCPWKVLGKGGSSAS